MSAGAEIVVASRGEPWWAIAASLFAVAIVLVLCAVVAGHSGGNVLEGPPPIKLAGDRFDVVRGRGESSAGTYVLAALDASHLGILAAQVRPFAADSYPRVEWRLHGPDPAAVKLAFLWRTLEQPSRSFNLPLEWRSGNVVAVEPGASDGWSGTITGVALIVSGNLNEPLVVESWDVPSVSAWSAFVEILRQWSAPFPFKGTSIHLPFDAERRDFAPLLIVVALAEGLALAGYYLVARRRRWPRDPRVLWAIFLIGWLMLDLRWQADLWRQLAQTAQQFAGKTLEEKHLASDDHAMFEWMRQVNAALPSPPVRILVLSDSPGLRARGAFFLYPHNIYRDLGPQRRVTSPELVRSGDYVLLLWYGGLTYDRVGHRLLWPDGRARPADEILAPADGMLLLRAR